MDRLKSIFLPGKERRPSLFFLLLVLWMGCQEPQKDQQARKTFPEDFAVLHPRYRKWPTPANNQLVFKSSPSLMWPATRKKGVRYAVRLCRDSTFTDASTIFAKDIPYTVFNPHRALTVGAWYWQYRVAGEPWSKTFKFNVGRHADTAVPPAYRHFRSAIPASHPRVLIDNADIPALMRKVKGRKDAAMILKNAESYLDDPLPIEGALPAIEKGNYQQQKVYQKKSKHLGFDALDAMKALCKAYILTGDNKYAGKGKALAMQVATWNPNGLSGFEDFGDGACMLTMALGFDTFNDKLDPDEKTSLLKRINTRGERFYQLWINNVDAKVLSNHVWQFLFHYFFRTALAVDGASPYADKWLRYMYALWLARAPVLGRMDGGWAGGLSYFTINISTLLDIPMVIKQYTGYDFIHHTPWYRNSASWIYYAFPPASSSDGFGDNTERLTRPKGYFLAYADALSKLTGSRVAATYAHKVERSADIRLEDTKELRWFRLRYLTGIKRPDTLTDGTLPLAMVFPDEGVVAMHSSLSKPKDNLMIAMRSSPFGSYSHMMADQNTFNLMYGGQRIFYVSGHKITMKDPLRLQWYKATVGHNGILIDGKGQPFGPAAYGWIPRFISGKKVSYAVGDASMAYFQGYAGDRKQSEKNLKHFRRHLLFLPPDIVVIYDVLRAGRPSTWSWLLHSPQRIQLNKSRNTFYSRIKGAAATCAFFSSAPVSWELTDTVHIPGAGSTAANPKTTTTDLDDWHLTAVTDNATSAVRFLTIIQVDTAQKKQHASIGLQRDQNNDILIGAWRIHAVLDTAGPPLLQAFSLDNKIAFTSSGSLRIKNKTFKPEEKSSAKLAEYLKDGWHLIEAADRLPRIVQKIPAEEAE